MMPKNPLENVALSPFLRDFVQTAPFPMTVKDTRTGQYILANAMATQRYGLTPETYCGLTFQEIGQQQNLLADHVAAVRQHDAQVCETQQPLPYQQIICTHDPFIRVEQMTKQPLLDQTKGVIAILTYSHDLTPRLDLTDLLALYQQYLPPKQAIQQCLKYLQLDTCFYTPPNETGIGSPLSVT